MNNIIRYLLCLISIVGILSCQNNVQYKEQICPYCKGTGKVKAPTSTKIFLGVITFGPGVMVETISCNYCNGTGVIKIRDLK